MRKIGGTSLFVFEQYLRLMPITETIMPFRPVSVHKKITESNEVGMLSNVGFFLSILS